MKFLGIENYIISNGISLRTFAMRCNMSSSTVSRMLSGKVDLKKSNIDKILEATNMRNVLKKTN